MKRQQGKIAREMNINVSRDTLHQFITNEQERTGQTIELKRRLTWEESLTDEQKEKVITLIRNSTSYEQARMKITREMNIDLSIYNLRQFITREQERIRETIALKQRFTEEERLIDEQNEQERTRETIELKPKLTWEERLTDEQKTRIIALVRDSTSFEEATRKIAREMNMSVSRSTLQTFIANEQERTGETIKSKPRVIWEQGLTDEQKTKIIALVRDSTSLRETKRKIAREMNMSVSRSTLQTFIANEQERTRETIKSKPRLTWEQGLTDEQKTRIIALVRDSTSFREATRKIVREMNMSVSRSTLQIFIASEQERTGQTIELKPRLTWADRLTDEQRKRIVVLVRENTNFGKVRDEIAREMDMDVSTDTLRQFIINEQERTRETIELKRRLSWAEGLTEEQKERIVILFRDSTSFREAKRKIAREMNINISTDTLRTFIVNEQKRTGETIKPKRRLTWEERLTDEKKGGIIALVQAGHSYPEIKREMNLEVSSEAIRQFILNQERKTGHIIRPRISVWEENLTSEEKEKIIALVQAGHSYPEIKREMNLEVSLEAIRQFILNQEREREQIIRPRVSSSQ